MAVLPSTRIVRGATGAQVSWQATDADGEPAAPAATPTVVVTRSDGTTISDVGAVAQTSTGPATATLPATATATVDWLTATWSVSGVELYSETIDVVGGTVASLQAIRVAEPSVASESQQALLAARRAAEDRFVATQHRSPFPRFYVERISGAGRSSLWLTWPDLIEVRWARVHSGSTYTALTADELASITAPDQWSSLTRSDGAGWPCGSSNIEVGYVFGLTSVPHDLFEAFCGAVRAQITRTNTGIPDKAIGWASADGVNFQIATPGQRGAIYGIPDIDDVWNRYVDPRPAIA
jgi:hypothetical protein